MYQTINLHDFRNAFQQMDRGAQFTYEGLETLFDFLTQFESDDTQIELDVIGFCCEYCEMTDYEIIDAYNFEVDFEKPLDIQVMEYLESNTAVCGVTSINTIVFQQF